jgi:hypothetical protein
MTYAAVYGIVAMSWTFTVLLIAKLLDYDTRKGRAVLAGLIWPLSLPVIVVGVLLERRDNSRAHPER